MHKPRRGGQIIARGERSEPLVGISIRRSPERAKDIERKSLSPLRGSNLYLPYQGFASLTPGYYPAPPPGA